MSSKEHLIPILGAAAASLIVGGTFGYCLARSGCCVDKSASSDKAFVDSRYAVVKSFSGEDYMSVVERYVMESGLCEPDVLRKLREATFELTDDPGMLCDAVEAQLIRMLLKISGAKKCIEVGTFTGYNALNMALALPPDGKVIACDISEEYVNVGKPYFQEAGASSKIEIHLRPALKTMDELIASGQRESFDFVFIDADKQNYNEYYERALVLVRKGGLIGVDNTLWSGRVCLDLADINNMKDDFLRETTLSVRALNEKIKNDKRIEMSFLELGDGFTICRKI